MKIKKYYEFKQQLIQEAGDEFTSDSDEETTDNEESADGSEDGAEDEEDKPLNDNPESYLKEAIRKLQKKIEALFDDVNDNEQEEVVSPETLIGPDGVDRSKSDKKVTKNNMTLKDMGARLESSDIAKSSKTHKSLVIKFTDDEFYYSLYVKVSLNEVIGLIEDGEELTEESIQKAYVKMKKISQETFEEMGTVNRNVMMADIDEDFIIELKLELDDEVGDDEDKEEFSIET